MYVYRTMLYYKYRKRKSSMNEKEDEAVDCFNEKKKKKEKMLFLT